MISQARERRSLNMDLNVHVKYKILSRRGNQAALIVADGISD